MRQSQLFSKTSRTVSSDEVSTNARLLTQAGFIDKQMAGAYSYLPLGQRVFDRVCRVIREEMNAIGGQELSMTSLQPRELWEATNRWVTKDEIMYKFGEGPTAVGLAWTHEEPVTHIATRFISSYRDLPKAVYQLQLKFRNEPRAKSGIMRTREFVMKDLYSFHRDEADLDRYYEVAKQAYLKVFNRCGLAALVVEASGGAFTTKYSHEFQVLSEAGEDVTIYCSACRYAQNQEVARGKVGEPCPSCGQGKLEQGKSVEVGNIFKLGTLFSEKLGLSYTDEAGKLHPVMMASYGIGPGRVMGTIVEVHHDEAGMVWPREVAPYLVHLVSIGSDPAILFKADELYRTLQAKGVEVLWDDRDDSPGVKFKDADLFGLPFRVVVSAKAGGKFELKPRVGAAATLVTLPELLNTISVQG